MSSIPSGFIPISLSAAAGAAQSTTKPVDQARASAAEGEVRVDLERKAAGEMDAGVESAESQADRDADGRLPWSLPRSASEDQDQAGAAPPKAPAPPPDAWQERGRQLDLEA